MFVIEILIIGSAICGSTVSVEVETQQLTHVRSIRQTSDDKEKNIVFDLPDITTTINLPSGMVQLEAFKSANNDRILQDTTRTTTSQLFWVSIGHPQFVKTASLENANDMKLFHFSSRGFSTYVEMMTTGQRKALATAARNKYQVNITDDQVVHLILSKFYCTLLMYDDAGNKHFVSGYVNDFRHFPLRMDFEVDPKSIERKLFLKLVNESESDLYYDCHIESNGWKPVRSNTLVITTEQMQQLGLKEKLFGPDGNNSSDNVYVTRNQMSQLAHEMYSTLNIGEECLMPATQFSEAIVNEIILQLSSNQFSQVPIDEVLSSLSKYGFDIGDDLQPDIIKRDAGSILKVEVQGCKSRIVLDESKYNGLAESSSASVGIPGLFSDSIMAAVAISESNVSSGRSLNDQLQQLNNASRNEAQWEIEGNRVVPISLNVVRLTRSRMETPVTISRIRPHSFQAPFEIDFKMYTHRSASMDMCQNFSSTTDGETLQSISQNVLSILEVSRASLNTTMILNEVVSAVEDLKIKTQEINVRQGKACPYGFDYVLEINQCLKLIPQPMTWNNGRDACNRVMPGVQMLTITNSAKKEAVQRYLDDIFAKTNADACNNTYWRNSGKMIWLSGQTRDPNQCGTPYVWKPEPGVEIPFSYSNWIPGQPDCYKNAERCIHVISGMNYTWNDASCLCLTCTVCEF